MSTRAAIAEPESPAAATTPAVSARRDYLLGILSGMAANISHDFIHPELILAGMVYALTGSKFQAALVTVISKAAILAPQLLVGTRLEHLPRKRPYFILATVLRGLGVAGMILALWMLSRRVDSISLGLLFLAYTMVCAFGGAGHVIFMDLTGRMVPTGRIGSFFGMRNFLGGAMSVVLGFAVIQPILGHYETVNLPTGYLILGAIGGTLAILSMVLFSLCRERDGPRAKNPTTLGESLRRGVRWLRTNANYRLYLWLRISFRINYLGLAFFIPYGTDRLRTAGSAAGMAVLGGILVATMKLSRVITSVIWGKLADRRGYRPCLLGGGICFLLAPSLALLAPLLPQGFRVPIPYVKADLDLPLCVYMLALAAIGAAFQGTVIGGNRFLIGTAPPHRRISYVGFLNTVTSPLTLLPLLGAWLADIVGMTALFGVLCGGGLLSVVCAARLTEQPVAAEAQP